MATFLLEGQKEGQFGLEKDKPLCFSGMESDHYMWSHCLVGHVRDLPHLFSTVGCSTHWYWGLLFQGSQGRPPDQLCACMCHPLSPLTASELSGASLMITLGLCTSEGVECVAIGIHTGVPESFTFCLPLNSALLDSVRWLETTWRWRHWM